jgi:hypothetical protein
VPAAPEPKKRVIGLVTTDTARSAPPRAEPAPLRSELISDDEPFS